jgi:hypothetical protein
MTYSEAVRDFKRRYWIDLLLRHDDNVSGAAREAGVRRSHVYRLLHALNVPRQWDTSVRSPAYTHYDHQCQK